MARKKNVEAVAVEETVVVENAVVTEETVIVETVVVDEKEVAYKKWYTDFTSGKIPETEKASDKFVTYSSKIRTKEEKTNSKGEAYYNYTFARKSSERVTPKALDKTFEINVHKAQVFLQNLHDEVRIADLSKKEDDLLKETLTDEKQTELYRVQSALKELLESSTAYKG